MNEDLNSVLAGGGDPVPIEWPEFLPFGEAPLLPAFPVKAMPTVLAQMTSQVAASVRVPPDLPAVLGLMVIAAAGAGRVNVEIARELSVPVNLYGVVAMEPGSRKSAAFSKMVKPLELIEEARTQDSLKLIEHARDEREVIEESIRLKKQQIAKAETGQPRDNLLGELARLRDSVPDVPKLPRILVDDVTPEGLARLMGENRGRVALFSAEGGIFGTIGGRYSKGGGPNLDLVLKAIDGERVAIDRASRESPIVLPRPLLTMGLAVQPHVLKSLGHDHAFRGRGLLGRILWSLPEDLVGQRLFEDLPIDVHVRQAYHEMIASIMTLDDERELPLKLTPEALEVWRLYHDDIEVAQADGGRLRRIRDWASKLPSTVARIAGGLHLAQYGSDVHDRPITEETMLNAWAIGLYFVEHALAAFGEIDADEADDLGLRVWRWIVKNHLKVVTARDIMRGPGLKLDQTKAATGSLVKRGYLLETATRRERAVGRPPGPGYFVRPMTEL
jgi:hypothetical protein